MFPVDKDQDRLADEEQIRPLIDRIHRRLAPCRSGCPSSRFPRRSSWAKCWRAWAGPRPRRPPGPSGHRAPRPPPWPSWANCSAASRRKNSPAASPPSSSAGRPTSSAGSSCSAAPPTPTRPASADLPESLLCRFIGRSGKFLLKIYARHNIWDLAARETFVHEIRTVDKEVTGNPLQVYEASRDMKQSYQRAAIYALITIVVLLWFDFGSLHYTILAMAPLALGVLQMFGLMGLLGIPLNSANMIVLPLIIGLGAENGIHIINDFRRRSAGYRRMSAATTTAVLINSLTTMVGFAALMVASHQGLWSLGRVLTIGMSCCLMSALVLPNLLVLLPGGQRRAACDEEEHPAAIVPLRLRSQPGSPVPEPHFVAIVRRESVGTADHAGRC